MLPNKWLPELGASSAASVVCAVCAVSAASAASVVLEVSAASVVLEVSAASAVCAVSAGAPHVLVRNAIALDRFRDVLRHTPNAPDRRAIQRAPVTAARHGTLALNQVLSTHCSVAPAPLPERREVA